MDLYYILGSPPCASVQMIAEALNVDLNLKVMNLQKKEHMTEEFLKINPQHSVPTLVDNGFTVWESRAICIYLIEKYGGNDNSLYPSDPQTRATINQRVIFDYGLYERFSQYAYAPLLGKPLNPEYLKKVEGSIEMLEKLLEGNEFVAGTEDLSVADVLLFSTLNCFEPIGINLESYPNIFKWFAKMKEVAPGREIGEKYFQAFAGFCKSLGHNKL